MSTETNDDILREKILAEIKEIQEELKNIKQDIVKKPATTTKKRIQKKKEVKQKSDKKIKPKKSSQRK